MPRRVFGQLAARRQAWAIPYDEEEIEATWNAPHRLLLFVNIADPADPMAVSMKIDGQAVQVRKAYSSVHPQGAKRTFVGFYADVSALEPDRRHEVELSLPDLEPGRFQGLFFDNVEPEHTNRLR